MSSLYWPKIEQYKLNKFKTCQRDWTNFKVQKYYQPKQCSYHKGPTPLKKWPYICIVWSSPNGYVLMIHGYKWFQLGSPSSNIVIPQNTWVFPKMVVLYPQIIHFHRVCHYKPSILGGFPPIFGNTHILKNHHMFEVRIFAEEFAMQFWIGFFILHLPRHDFQKRLYNEKKCPTKKHKSP